MNVVFARGTLKKRIPSAFEEFSMRIFSHTPSNTEIVCALGCSHLLIGVDEDSDYPVDVVKHLPKAGRDLDLKVDIVAELKPDIVLTSLTVPGHEKVVEELRNEGLDILVCDPVSLEDVFEDIRRIAALLNVPERGEKLVEQMQAAMPCVDPPAQRPKILVEWRPKPVIVPGKQSWVSDMIHRAGGVNPWADLPVKSQPMHHDKPLAYPVDAIVMSWCGVKVQNYRAKVVRRRNTWTNLPAFKNDRIVPISEEYLGRPSPRLMEGYRQLRVLIEEIQREA